MLVGRRFTGLVLFVNPDVLNVPATSHKDIRKREAEATGSQFPGDRT